MARVLRFVFLVALLGAIVVPQASAAGGSPLWILHMQNYPGGISNGVRARLTAPHVDTRMATLATTHARPSSEALDNVQANADGDPPLPQTQTAVAFNPNDPMNAVAAANDYCGDGYWMGATFDGGQTWTSIFKDPKTSTGDRCFGSDPTVVYSLRDSAFYVGTLCFFGTGISEVQVWNSVDGGLTWTDSTKAAIVITNQDESGSIDPSVFYDKELLALDNNPTSPHYGRLYVTFIKFHMTLPSGRSDYCPAQVAYTDDIPTPDPSTAIWSHTAIVPDAPGARGVGPSANQWAMPVVDDTGALDVGYAIEECNTAYDPAMFFTRSVDGGASFSDPVQIDKPGQFADNANRQDTLPAKNARLPISPSLAFDATRDRLLWAYQNNLHRGVSGADISLQTSDDFGATWSDAQTISLTETGAAAPRDQFFPWLSVDESGNVHAIWYDNRNDPANKLIETFQALSTDGGATWSQTDISTAAWDPGQSFFTCGCFIGDYNAIAASDDVIYPVWTDGRNTPGRPLGQTDIFTNVEIQG
jgi:hypothetical protein